MRFINACKLTLVLVCTFFVTSTASAFAYYIQTDYAGDPLQVGDSVIVDCYIDAETGLTLLGFAVLYDPVELEYDAVASAALPPKGPGTSGAEASYILYTPGKPPTVLYPLQVPAFLNFPSPPAGKKQVNVNYADQTFTGAVATATNLYVATLLFNVVDTGDGQALIELCNTCGGSILRASDVVVPPEQIPLNGSPITVTVPEPATASLALAACTAVAGLAVYRRRRRV